MNEKEPGGKRAPRKRIQRDQKPTESGSYGRKGSFGAHSDLNSGRPRDTRDASAPSRPGFGKRGETPSSGGKPFKSRNSEEKYPHGKPDRPARSSRTEQSGRGYRDDRPSENRAEKPAYGRKKYSAEGEQKPRSTRPSSRNAEGFATDRKERNGFGKPDRPTRSSRTEQSGRGYRDDRPSENRAEKPAYGRKKYSADREQNTAYAGNPRQPEKEQREWKPRRKPAGGDRIRQSRNRTDKKEIIRLNKYLADAGICSRREADDLIQAGTVTVNGEIITELGTKVSIHDKVNYGGQTLRREKLRYVLLNKPKGYITTSDDPFNRKTVMELVKTACEERIYPVGRLDRNTLGLLLLTNDGDLAKKMMHPKHGVAKLYHVFLDKPLTKHDLLQIAEGLELEDGKAEVDAISYVNKDDTKKEIGIEIHSGKNRIVRRIFEHLGYHVVKLDRVMLGGLTKLDLPRGKFRHLTSAEISMLMRIR
ncbi:pseudouridine synthase [Bacteroidales bacterium]